LATLLAARFRGKHLMAAGIFQRMTRIGGAGILSAALAACNLIAPVEPSLKPQARPAALPAPVVAKPTSQKSAMLRSYLNQVQTAQLTQGLLRRDGGGADTPFTADMLARNFEKIAFFNEYDGNFSGRGGQSPLRRWDMPVRMDVIFGAGVPPSQRNGDTYDVRRYVGSSTKNSRTKDICDAAKAAGTIVYTIGFEAPYSGQVVLADCASSDAHYFDVDGLEITEAFASIASSIRKLRLTQ